MRGLAAGRGANDVGVKEEEDDHGEGHEVHIDEEDDAGMVKAPAGLEAARGVGDTDGGKDGGKDEQRGGTIVGEVGEDESDGQGQENEQGSTDEGVATEVKEVPAENMAAWSESMRRHASGRGLHALSIGAW